MAEDTVVRALPTTDVRRIERRDAKMWRRETERETRTGQSRSRCPCTLCLFGRPLLRRTHAIHLREFGRHPMKRLQPQANSYVSHHFCILQNASLVTIRRWSCYSRQVVQCKYVVFNKASCICNSCVRHIRCPNLARP